MSLLKKLRSLFFKDNSSPVSSSSFYTRRCFFEFPDMDDRGCKRLTVYTLPLSGIKQSYDGVSSQDTMLHVSRGDQVLLYAIPSNKHDKTAVLVTDLSGDFLGWIPRDSAGISSGKSLLKEDIYDRISNGITVLARVNSFEPMESNDDYLICNIEIARYAKS